MPPETEGLVDLLHQAWQGEWYGVRVYGELAATRADPSETATMLELVVLETYVLGELTVALLSLGIESDPGQMEAEADVDIGEHVSDDWRTLIGWLQSDAEAALAHYRQLPELAASEPSLAGLAHLVVAHEEALISFAQRTLAGEPEALGDVRALLRVDGESGGA